MGDVVPFRDKKRWTRPEDYGHQSGPPGGGGGKPPRKPKRPRSVRKRRWLRPWVVWLAITMGIGAWVAEDPMLYEPPAVIAGEPETVSAPFTICGERFSRHCVIDGDTIRIGERSIRMIGIDAPETRNAACPAEAKRGAAATKALAALLNEGPFTMVGRLDAPRDQYGRELKSLKRTAPDGGEQLIGETMVRAGHADAYRGDFKTDWCAGQGQTGSAGITERPAQAA